MAQLSKPSTSDSMNQKTGIQTGEPARNRRTQRRVEGALLAIAIMMVTTAFGFAIRNNQPLTEAETELLRQLTQAPAWLQSISTVIAHMFSTVGCFVLLGIGLVLDVMLLKRNLKSNRSTLLAHLGAYSGAHSGNRLRNHSGATIAKIVALDALIAFAPMLFIMTVKWVVRRPRPVTSVGHALLPWDPSFPSGHTAVAAMVAVLVWIITRHWLRLAAQHIETVPTANQAMTLQHTAPAQSATHYMATSQNAQPEQQQNTPQRTRVVVTLLRVLAVMLVIAVACSRLILGLHYPTDVLTSAIVYPALAYTLWLITR